MCTFITGIRCLHLYLPLDVYIGTFTTYFLKRKVCVSTRTFFWIHNKKESNYIITHSTYYLLHFHRSLYQLYGYTQIYKCGHCNPTMQFYISKLMWLFHMHAPNIISVPNCSRSSSCGK